MAVPSAEIERIWEAARILLPAEVSPEFAWGMMGESLRRSGEFPTLHDVKELTLPGLLALGISGECVVLPTEEKEYLRLLRERLRHGVPVPLLRFTPCAFFIAAQQESEEAGEEAPHPDDGEQELTAQALVTHDDGEFSDYTHILLLRRARHIGQRSVNRRDTLLRWLAFAAAFPARIVASNEEDAERRSAAAAFLTELAGKKRDPMAVRFRRAAQSFVEADINDALTHLREAILWELNLPTVVLNALMLPEDAPLTDIERRELIYMARAGTRDLKALAARRLCCESAPDAQVTCQQLRFAPDAWVRAASTR